MDELKPLRWIAGSKDDLSAMPLEVRRHVGYALYDAQEGGKHHDAKVLKGFGGWSVLEIVVPFDSNAYRAIYTVRFASVVYVLHAFQKKSTKGIATPQREIDLIGRRLAAAEQQHKERQKAHGGKDGRNQD